MHAHHDDVSLRDALSRRGFLVLGALTAAGAAGCSSSGGLPAKPQPGKQVDLTFDRGSLGAPITTHIGARAGRAFAHAGGYGCRLQPTTATKDVACLIVGSGGFAQNQPYAAFSMFFRLVTRPRATDTYMNLFEITNTSSAASKSQFTVFFRKNKLCCDFAFKESIEIGPMPSAGEWHQIQAIVDYGKSAYTAQVSVDRAAPKTLKSQNGKKPESVRSLYIHYPSVKVDYTMDVDDIKLRTSASAPTFIS